MKCELCHFLFDSLPCFDYLYFLINIVLKSVILIVAVQDHEGA